MFGRAHRPPRLPRSEEEKQEDQKRLENFSGEGEGHRADGESRLSATPH
jgi:hypothetical protein